MIYVGIDVAKTKHDCFIANEQKEALFQPFTIPNNLSGFTLLYERIASVMKEPSEVRVGLEATGHYSYNLLNFLISKGFQTFFFNPLHTNLYRKSQSLRKTKTDSVDAKTIAEMLTADFGLCPYSEKAFFQEDLKSLTRYRFEKVRERAKLKQSVTRLVCILFPEIEELVPSLHLPSVYAVLERYPSAGHIFEAEEKSLLKLILETSKGRYGEMETKRLREAAKVSIGSNMPLKSMELRHTIRLIREFDEEIKEVEEEIKRRMDEIRSPILGIPGISYRMGAMILAEIGDIVRFSSADKLLAYAGLSPTTYQSGQMKNAYSHMEKRGSKYLRYALFNATKYVCHWDKTFADYLEKKRAEGKPYNVAISHAAKKLVRVIYKLEKTGEGYKRSEV